MEDWYAVGQEIITTIADTDGLAERIREFLGGDATVEKPKDASGSIVESSTLLEGRNHTISTLRINTGKYGSGTLMVYYSGWADGTPNNTRIIRIENATGNYPDFHDGLLDAFGILKAESQELSDRLGLHVAVRPLSQGRGKPLFQIPNNGRLIGYTQNDGVFNPLLGVFPKQEVHKSVTLLAVNDFLSELGYHGITVDF